MISFKDLVSCPATSARKKLESIFLTNSIYDLNVNRIIFLDTSSGEFTIQFPSQDVVSGDEIILIDIGGNLNNEPVTITNLSKVMNIGSTNFILNINYTIITFIFVSSSYGWFYYYNNISSSSSILDENRIFSSLSEKLNVLNIINNTVPLMITDINNLKQLGTSSYVTTTDSRLFASAAEKLSVLTAVNTTIPAILTDIAELNLSSYVTTTDARLFASEAEKLSVIDNIDNLKSFSVTSVNSINPNNGNVVLPLPFIKTINNTLIPDEFGNVNIVIDGSGLPTVTDITGNSGTANRLFTSRNILLSGVISGSVNFDGSQDVTLTTRNISNINILNQSPPAIIDFDILNYSILYYKLQTTSNFEINFILNTLINIGQSITVKLIIKQGTVIYYPNSIKIDGNLISLSNEIITTGNTNNIEIYEFNIIKLSNDSFDVLVSQNYKLQELLF